MAFIKNNAGSFSLVERYKDESGRWKTRTLAGLACSPSVEKALEAMPADIAWAVKDRDEWAAKLKRNRFWRFGREEYARMDRLVEVWTEQYRHLLDCLESHPEAAPAGWQRPQEPVPTPSVKLDDEEQEQPQ